MAVVCLRLSVQEKVGCLLDTHPGAPAMEFLVAIFSEGLHGQLDRGRALNEPHTDRGHEITGRDVVPGAVYTDDLVEIAAFEVQHGEWDTDLHGPFPTLGYRITTPDRTVVISGDTGPFPEMVIRYADSDVLVHEVYSSAGFSSRPAEWQTYHPQSHTSGTHLGRVATEADPGVLVLNHQLLWHATEDDLIGEVTAAYDGPLVYGRDLDVI